MLGKMNEHVEWCQSDERSQRGQIYGRAAALLGAPDARRLVSAPGARVEVHKFYVLCTVLLA
jgi:hypothetical protein